MQKIKIIDITPENILDYGICGYKNIKREGYPEKIAWIEKNYPKGLRIKSILSEEDGVQGMIEYIPGEYCWRPVKAEGYLFIHCLFVGFKKSYKGKGYAGLLIDECLTDAEELKKKGVAVVTRKGSFMAGKEIFLKKDFKVVDTAPPDFELLVKKIDEKSADPGFINNDKKLSKFKKGLTIIRSDQCPYTVKNVKEITEISERAYKLKVNLIENKNHIEAQANPCAFGSFGIIYKGEIIAHHPISKTRFVNIINSCNSN